MSFGDFVIHCENKFLRNIYTEEQIKDSHHVKDLESYYESFEQYILICVGLSALLNNFNRNDFINLATEEFVEDKFAGEEISAIKNTINKTEIKIALSTTHGNVPKFNIKIYAYVYDELVCYPRSDIDYKTITTNKFFTNVHQLIRGKFHLHDSHITGKIFGYAHDFCNTTLAEKSTPEIPFVAHNFFGFDLFYYMKAYIASAWCSKELNIGGSNLTNLTQVNYGNISGEIRLIDSLKFYQRSLGEISSTLTTEEKNAVKKLTEKFLNEHYYFCNVCPFLSWKKKDKILETISKGKGVIPYEIIVDIKSFFIKPENEFQEKTAFFSELKQSAVNDEDYENCKYLYQAFKMRNLGDLNDLYNTQDIILLTEIIESRFQVMQNTYGFNPRKCNSLSTYIVDIHISTYIVDSEFDVKNVTEREFAYNEIYPPIIEKQIIIDPCERSVFQLLEQFIRSEKNAPKAHRSTAKAHANLL